jgi:hypothetical protein
MLDPRPAYRLLSLAALLAVATIAYADPAISLSLNGAAEVAPVATEARGSGKIVVLPDRTISGSIQVSGMTPTMAHIHMAAAGRNGPPIITLDQPTGDTFTLPPGSRLSEDQYTNYALGLLYVNVHSASHPDGEIRAQLLGKPMRIAK